MKRQMGTAIRIGVIVVMLAVMGQDKAMGAEGVSSGREGELIKVLVSNGTAEAKDAACRELQGIGSRASIPALASLLTEPACSRSARSVLEVMPYPEAGGALLAALGPAEGAVKLGIIQSLGQRGETGAVEPLSKLTGSSDRDVARAAIRALGAIGTERAAEVLAGLRKDNSPEIRLPAAEASLVAAEGLWRRNEVGVAAGIYQELQDEKWPAFVRMAAIRGWLHAAPDKAKAWVTGALKGNDMAARMMAAGYLSESNDEGLVLQVAGQLSGLPADARALVIGALGDGGNPAAVPGLIQAAKQGDREVRQAAIGALGRIGGLDSLAALCELMAGNSNAQEKQVIISTLEGLEGDGVDRALTGIMQKAPEADRPIYIGLLALRHVSSATPILIDEARSSEGLVRQVAVKAIGQLGTAEDLPTVLSFLVDMKGDSDRDEVERAVVSLAGNIEDEAARADVVAAELDKANRIPIRCSLLRVLGRIGNAKALETVGRYLRADNPEVRETAVRALASWPNIRALDRLAAELKNTSDPVLRVVIMRGCARLIAMDPRPASVKLDICKVLVGAAERVEDKKQVLGVLANVSDARALDLVMPFLNEAGVKMEAELAALKIAEGLTLTAPEVALKTVRTLQAKSTSDPVRRQAAEILKRAEQLEGYITIWQVSGPYEASGVTGEALFNKAFGPESAGGQAKWRVVTAGTLAGRPEMVDLAGYLGGESKVGYARTWIQSEKEQAALLEVGADDEVGVWLNGKQVLNNGVPGAAVAGEDKVAVTLKQGWNQLLVKVGQWTGPWEFCVRLRNRDGGRIEGVVADAWHEMGGVVQETVAMEEEEFPEITPVAKDAWQSLFNGKDLTGWRATGDAIFKVEDGCLVGTQTSGQGGDLWTESQWDDFELYVKYRMVWPANSGFWFRHDGKNGYQYDILKYRDPVTYSGSLYCPGKLFVIMNLNEGLEDQEGWNEARVRAEGDALTLWLNGKMTGQCRDNTFDRGAVGIQIHPGKQYIGMEIIVKEIRIAPLKKGG